MPDIKLSQKNTGLTEEEFKAIEMFYGAFEGRLELLDHAVTDDWQDIPLAPGQAPGREGMKPLIAGFSEAFSDAKVTIHDIIGARGRAAVRATISGTHQGEWFGVAPTGSSFELTIHEFHYIAAGRLTHTWHLEDWFGWLFQVGAWPTTLETAQMKAARITAYESIPAVVEVDRPTPGDGEVLVRVEAASLNPLDVKLQQGVMHQFFPLDFPYTMGTDVSGTIEKVGDGVRGHDIGDRVVLRTDPTSGGAFAEFVVAPASALVNLPASISAETAAGLPTTGGTAWQAIFEMAQLKPKKGLLDSKKTVLVHGGSGGVGSFAVQFARMSGARVIATASGPGIQVARRLGADKVIDYRTDDFERKVSDVDVVLDTVGGETQTKSFNVLRTGGKLISTVSPPDEALASAHKVEAAFVFHQSDSERLKHVVEAVAGGAEVLIDSAVSLGDLPNAFARLRDGGARGKIVIRF